MFYSQFILAKKGPLGTIWIAAHLERKLRKNQVADTDIGVSVDSILFPDVPIALRLSSHLLLGVVRIYSRKVNYLFDDCSDTLLKVKQAFRSTAVDLPPEQSKAPYHSITLPETFDLDDFELPDNEIFHGNFVDHHVSTREQITLQDTMENVSFPTSQFGPDERFGDGDASLIGLDLDEDLFMKGELAGMSENLATAAADREASSPKQGTPFRGDEHNEGISDFPSASPMNYFTIQAPSTPGLMEQPNFCAQETRSDDHMDEDQNLAELASKEVSGTASSQVYPCNMHSRLFNSNEDCSYLDDQECSKVRSENAHEEVELMNSCNAQPLKLKNDNAEGTRVVESMDCLRSKLNCGTLQMERDTSGDVQSKGYSDHQNEVTINEVEMQLADNDISTEVDVHYSCDRFEKNNLNGSYFPDSDHRSGDDTSLVVQGDLRNQDSKGIKEIGGSDLQDGGLNLKISETLENNGDEKSSALNTGLRACNSRDLSNIDGVVNAADASSFLSEDAGPPSTGISDKEHVTNVSESSIDLQDLATPNLMANQISHELSCADNGILAGRLDSISACIHHLEEKNGSRYSDLSGPEKLLSMPTVNVAQAGDTLIELTPGTDLLAEGVDGSGGNFTSGKKRSYTESTLTIQSLNSEPCGAAQSKQSVEYIPEDDDLLSSILGGKKSTGLKLKLTPPATDNLPTKRQQVSVRSSSHKRKVLVDDTMVLHGDMIREQLINTEDIRRVRKKAPCTRFEAWVLQKHSSVDGVFSDSVFTGMASNLRSLHREAFDLTGIKIVPSDGRKSSNETLGNGHQQLRGNTLEETCRQGTMFVVDGSILQKELETFDNEVAKQMLQNDRSGNKVGIESHNTRTEPDIGEDLSVASGLKASSSATPPEVSLASDTIADLTYENNTTDGDRAVNTVAFQLIDQDYHLDSARDEVFIVEGVSDSVREGHEIVDTSEKIDLKVKSDVTCLSDGIEGISITDNAVVAAELEDTCSLPACDGITDAMPLDGRTSPTVDNVTEECQLSETGFESAKDNLASDLRRSDSFAMLNNHPVEDMNVDFPNPLQADLSYGNTHLDERENLVCVEADPKSFIDSASIPVESGDPTEHANIWGDDAIEHDTDFLNVYDDDVAEDYESDMPNPEEKRILDNSGWSIRTRAVANYLKAVFVKEAMPAEKVISLESLLAKKSRKEASRMFFETLVLRSKDYIDTEQVTPYANIKIKPTEKLLISEFSSHK